MIPENNVAMIVNGKNTLEKTFPKIFVSFPPVNNFLKPDIKFFAKSGMKEPRKPPSFSVDGFSPEIIVAFWSPPRSSIADSRASSCLKKSMSFDRSTSDSTSTFFSLSPSLRN